MDYYIQLCTRPPYNSICVTVPQPHATSHLLCPSAVKQRSTTLPLPQLLHTFLILFIDGVNTPIDPKKLQHFVLWWFYVRLGVVDNILKVGHNWSMGRCQISKMIVVDLQGIFLQFYPCFQLQYFTWKCHQLCWIIPYTISRATRTPSPS